MKKQYIVKCLDCKYQLSLIIVGQNQDDTIKSVQIINKEWQLNYWSRSGKEINLKEKHVINLKIDH